MNDELSRRGFFAAFRRPLGRTRGPAAAKVIEAEEAAAPAAMVAVVQGRHCLALTSFCSACVERCPVPGAMKKERGLPMVVADACTGCGVCQEVCPAPRNAVLIRTRRRIPAPQTA